MSKYSALWAYIGKSDGETLRLTFAEMEHIAGVPMDHSFLRYKAELVAYGWRVEKVSLKEQTVLFYKTAE